MQLAQMHLSAHTYIRTRDETQCTFHICAFTAVSCPQHTSAHSAWNSNFNVHSDERTNPLASATSDTKQSAFVVENYTDSLGAMLSDWE